MTEHTLFEKLYFWATIVILWIALCFIVGWMAGAFDSRLGITCEMYRRDDGAVVLNAHDHETGEDINAVLSREVGR